MYAAIALMALMLLTWAVAVWASYDGEGEHHEQAPSRQASLRKVA